LKEDVGEDLVMSTTQKPVTTTEPMRIILHGVSWAAYKALRDVPANNHIRMTYLDGTLELMSPEYVHNKGARYLDILVCEVADAFDVLYQGIGTTTLRRRRRKKLAGQACEADSGFYFGAHVDQIVARTKINLSVDPPPDLAIEVDNTADSRWKLPVYARLRVPEVWCYDVNAATLWFGRVGAAGKYDSIEQSVVLPMLNRGWVLDVLTRAEALSEPRYKAHLKGWIRAELNPLLP
jgi:Uma2 family endonuclease